LEAELFVANPLAPFGQLFLGRAEAAVPVVEPRGPVVELLLAPLDAAHLHCSMLELFDSLDLASLDLRDRFCEPRATFIQLGGDAVQLALACIESLRAVLQPVDSLFALTYIAKLVRELRLLLRDLRGAPTELLLLLGVARGLLGERLLLLVELALAFVRSKHARLELRPLLLQRSLLHLELFGTALELGRA
jgi:hypothetical protein